jgi:hypothetical protein
MEVQICLKYSLVVVGVAITIVVLEIVSGGGIIFIAASSIENNGKIVSRGSNAPITICEGSMGGGAGGSIYCLLFL